MQDKKMDASIEQFPYTMRKPVFMFQQPLFSPKSTGVSNQIAICTNYPMTGNNDPNRIFSIRSTHCTHFFFIAQPDGERTIGCGCSIAQSLQGFPDTNLKRGSLQGKWKIKYGSGSGKIFI